MTREEAAKLLPIIKAYSEGKTIQIKPKEGKFWSSSYTDINFSDLFMRTADYRIKPEPKYRPFKDAEECWNEMLKHQPVGWVKATANNIRCKRHLYVLITNLQIYTMRLSGGDEEKIKDAFELYTFADGTPFGVKEEK